MFETVEAQVKAAEELNGSQLDDNTLSVQKVLPKDQLPVRPRRKSEPKDEKEEPKKKKQKKRRPKKKSEDLKPRRNTGEPSLTTVYVGNLPFKLTDAEFLDMFTSRGFQVKASHVVRDTYNNSRGFGFCEFETNDEQQRAIRELQNIDLSGRVISVNVAREQLRKE